MKLRITSNVTIIEKSKNDYEYEGKKGTSYSVIAMQKNGESTEVDSVSVTQDVYDRVQPMTIYSASGHVDTKYKRVLFDHIEPLKSGVK